jgi:hypothetical protein
MRSRTLIDQADVGPQAATVTAQAQAVPLRIGRLTNGYVESAAGATPQEWIETIIDLGELGLRCIAQLHYQRLKALLDGDMRVTSVARMPTAAVTED